MTTPVTDETTLIADINAANAAASGTVTITISGTINESTALPPINLQSGVTLDIVGENNAELDGNGLAPGAYGGLYVGSGNVNVSNLAIVDEAAVGSSGNGGLGGGLFVAPPPM
jgi:hypothetical protein